MEYGSTASAQPLFFFFLLCWWKGFSGALYEWIMHCDWNQFWKNRQRRHCCSPFKINIEKFSDPSSHGQSTFCFKLIGAAGWLWQLIFLCVPTDYDVAALWNGTSPKFSSSIATLLWSRCCGSLIKYGESTSLTETFLSLSISQIHKCVSSPLLLIVCGSTRLH